MSDPAEESILVPSNDPKKADKNGSGEQADGAAGPAGKGKGKDVDGDGPEIVRWRLGKRGADELTRCSRRKTCSSRQSWRCWSSA